MSTSVQINQLLDAVIKFKGSDLHLTVGRPASIRVDGVLRKLGKVNLTGEDTLSMMKSITSEQHQVELDLLGGTDFGFSFGDVCRFRVSVFKQRGNIAIVLRLIPTRISTMEELKLPEIFKQFCHIPRGLVLVTGPTGSGKSTTLAAMVDHINEVRHDHIVTIEDPVEFIHQHKNCIVNHREIGPDVTTFTEALRRVLRQDPDIILVGEMRDLETISSAITAAETGHLVFGTLHTIGAAETINRIVDAFPSNQQEQIRTQLATTLVGVVSQTLLPHSSGTGRVAAFDIMMNTSAVQNLIRENKAFRINSVIETSRNLGMRLMDDHLFELFTLGTVLRDIVLSKAQDRNSLEKRILEWEEEQAVLKNKEIKKSKSIFK